MDTKAYLKGKSSQGYEFFGPHKKEKGYIFRLLATNADEVYIMGDFNDWKKDKLRKYKTGVFSITIKEAKINDRYQFIIKDKNGNLLKKIDPYVRKIDTLENCAIITDSSYKFKNKYINKGPINIYQVHLGSLLKNEDFKFIDLIRHAKANNFTHIQLMPLTEHVNYKTMGFTSIGLFALSKRYGEIADFKNFVDLCHKEGIGVIVDLDLGKFDSSPYYLDNFDGENPYSYDYDDIKYNYFGDINFDFAKDLTKSYILSAADYWINEYRIDGINLTNIENIIYWQGDKTRGINESAYDFIEIFIEHIRNSKVLALASFNGIYDFDLPLDYCFDNSLRNIISIMQKAPMLRDDYKREIYKLINADNREKILGFSYIDSYLNEASLAMKMYGSSDIKYRQLMSLFTLLYTLNSSKMLFMGDESANLETFSIYQPRNLENLNEEALAFNKFSKDLTKLYLTNEALHNSKAKIELLDIEGYSIYAFKRSYKDSNLLIIVNLTDVEYKINNTYKLKEILNTEDLSYKGSGNINGLVNKGDYIKVMPFASLIFEIEKGWLISSFFIALL